MFDLDEELGKLPMRPGVYIMHDKKDVIIYVGKAINLKNRVRQYFQSSRNQTAKIRKMVENIAYFEYIVTDSEVEALILECNLIKEHSPKYNTMLKDGKSYPYIRVTVNEAFPRISMVRQIKKDKSKYFGPFTSNKAVNDTIDLIRKLFCIRSCNRSLPKDIGKMRPCLYYHIGQCKAPCMGYIDEMGYDQNVKEMISFLNGNYRDVEKMLEEKMAEASEKMEFEKALEFRDLLTGIHHIVEKQKINNSNEQDDKDVIACAMDKDNAVVQIFFIRQGKLIGREHFHMTGIENQSRADVIEAFIKQFYSGTPYLPKTIMIQEEIEESQLIQSWLKEIKGQNVYLKVPKKGSKEKLIELAEQNAGIILRLDGEKLIKEKEKTVGAMMEIQKLIGLEHILRIESYDISNISGFLSVGSMVVFEEGKPKKNDYRKFKIKSVNGPDDYASMNEVLTRRFQHGRKEEAEQENNSNEIRSSFTKYPDLILMDGGKGQVNVALKVLEELGFHIPVCGMVKDEKHRTRGLYFQNEELLFDRSTSEAFKLITRIQDETHRFAIEYHKSLRSRQQIHSVLDDIPGVGEVRRKILMKSFPSIDSIKSATLEELAQVSGIDKKTAQQIFDFFSNKK